jgi:formate hydrogenlyase subunit 3/multisubunit Na+/H+ antiporter MnhD subunit
MKSLQTKIGDLITESSLIYSLINSLKRLIECGFMTELFLVILFLYAFSGFLPLSIRNRRIWYISSFIAGCGGILLIFISLVYLFFKVPDAIFIQREYMTFPILIGMDRLSAIFSLLLGILTLSIALYTPGYLQRMHGKRLTYVVCGFIPLFLMSMLLVILARTTFTFLMFWEIMATLSFFLF